MVPSYVTMPVHVTTKEMIPCFTLSVILSCLNLQTFYLIYLYLGVLTTYLPLSWAPSVVLAVSVAGYPGCPSPWLAPDEGFQHLQVLAVLAVGHPDCPLPLKYPENLFRAQPVCGPPACTLQKNIRSRYCVRAMDTLVEFSKLTYAVTSELAQGALPLHGTWVSSMVLLHVVLQSLWGEEVLGTEWTLIKMHLSMHPKSCHSFKFFATDPTPYCSVFMFP